MIETTSIAVTTTGGDGAAVGTARSPRALAGELYAIHLDWAGTAPGTSDITVTVEAEGSRPAVTLYSKENAATDLWIYPTVEQTDTAGVGRSTYQRIVIAGRIKVTVAGCNALAPAVTATLYVKS